MSALLKWRNTEEGENIWCWGKSEQVWQAIFCNPRFSSLGLGEICFSILHSWWAGHEKDWIFQRLKAARVGFKIHQPPNPYPRATLGETRGHRLWAWELPSTTTPQPPTHLQPPLGWAFCFNKSRKIANAWKSLERNWLLDLGQWVPLQILLLLPKHITQ